MPLLTRPMFSDSFELSPIKAMELAAAKVPGVVSLAQGIPSFETPEVIRSFVKEKIDAGLCDKYSLTNGLVELREEVADALQKENLLYDPETEIIITVGSIEAVTATLLACTTPGDEVIIPSPTYASYPGCIKLAGCIPKFAELDEDHNFDLDPGKIEDAITRRTRAIFYCSPNNPTGTIFSEEKTRELMALAEKHDLLIITDEVYKDFYYTDDSHFTPAVLPQARERVIRICSFSKAYAMTGWRVGFMHADRSFIVRILKYHDSMVTCAPVVSQYAAIAALRFGDDFLAEFRDECRRRRDFTIRALDEMSQVLDYQTPCASYFVFPRIKDTIPLAHDSRRLAYDILDNVALALVPGVAFGPSGESHLRIVFGRAPEHLQEGLSRLYDYFSGARRAARIRVTAPARASMPTRAGKRHGLRRRLAGKALAWGARWYLKRNKPVVVGIAGVRGKTVFKRIVADLLERKWNTRSNILSYNTEIGLPLSILRLKLPRTFTQKGFFPLDLLYKAAVVRDRTEMLVLEYGIANREDAVNLKAIASPDWLVICDISSSDLSLDHRSILEGIRHIAAGVPEDRIFWPMEDARLQELGVPLLSEMGVDSSQLKDERLHTPEGVYPLEREFVGRSAQLGALAAVRLGEKLGMTKPEIERFLGG